MYCLKHCRELTLTRMQSSTGVHSHKACCSYVSTRKKKRTSKCRINVSIYTCVRKAHKKKRSNSTTKKKKKKRPHHHPNKKEEKQKTQRLSTQTYKLQQFKKKRAYAKSKRGNRVTKRARSSTAINCDTVQVTLKKKKEITTPGWRFRLATFEEVRSISLCVSVKKKTEVFLSTTKGK